MSGESIRFGSIGLVLCCLVAMSFGQALLMRAALAGLGDHRSTAGLTLVMDWRSASHNPAETKETTRPQGCPNSLCSLRIGARPLLAQPAALAIAYPAVSPAAYPSSFTPGVPTPPPRLS